MIGAAGALALALVAAQEDIVVSAPRLAEIDTAALFADHCFHPARLSGRFLPPPAAAGWRPLDADARARFAVSTAPGVGAWGIVDGRRALVLEQGEARASDRDGGRSGVIERRCVLTIVGDPRARGSVDAMSRLFRGGGTMRHVGHPDGAPPVDGWRQRVWTAIPSRRAKAWIAGGRDTFVLVTDRSFYDNAEYVVGEVKLREGEPRAGGAGPIAVVSLLHRLRP